MCSSDLNGIGRPSTYAATITTITSREYVTREGKSFKPTELGEVITKLMKERFPDIVNIKFTAAVEKELDEVQSGQEDWVHTLHDFYDDFEKTLKKAKTEMDGVKIQLEEDKTPRLPELRQADCRQIRPLWQVYRLLRLPGVQDHAKNRQRYGCKVPEVRRQDHREKIEARPCVLRLRQLPEV